MGSPQQQRLLCDHLLIIPELNPVQAGLMEQAVTNTKRNTEDLKWVVPERDPACLSTKQDVTGVGMRNFDPSVGGTTTLRQLKKNAYFPIHQRERRLIQ